MNMALKPYLLGFTWLELPSFVLSYTESLATSMSFSDAGVCTRPLCNIYGVIDSQNISLTSRKFKSGLFSYTISMWVTDRFFI